MDKSGQAHRSNAGRWSVASAFMARTSRLMRFARFCACERRACCFLNSSGFNSAHNLKDSDLEGFGARSPGPGA